MVAMTGELERALAALYVFEKANPDLMEAIRKGSYEKFMEVMKKRGEQKDAEKAQGEQAEAGADRATLTEEVKT